MFDNRKTPREIVNYNLFRGVTDWTNLKQFDYYEKGYPFLIVLRYPKFIELNMQYESPATQTMLKSYLHILEHEFVGLEGIENITTATGEFTNGIRTVNYINKVEQASGTFTMNFRERSGMVITKFNEYYLTGVKDKETQVKTYHGLIDTLRERTDTGFKYTFDPGVDKEVFTFLYFVTDNTMSQIEAAYLICGAQPTTAELSIADQKKGEIDTVDLSCQFNGIALILMLRLRLVLISCVIQATTQLAVFLLTLLSSLIEKLQEFKQTSKQTLLHLRVQIQTPLLSNLMKRLLKKSPLIRVNIHFRLMMEISLHLRQPLQLTTNKINSSGHIAHWILLFNIHHHH